MSNLDDTATHEALPRLALSLNELASRAGDLEAIRKQGLGWGDQVVVVTRNSVYTLRALAKGEFAVSGGWFDRHGPSPTVVRINGCTWGGRAICEEIIAAPGLFLEFANGVTTTRIKSVTHLAAADEPAAN